MKTNLSYEPVGGVAEVEDLDFLGDGVAYGYGQFVFALAEAFAVEQALQRHYARAVVGHFDAYAVGQGYDAHAAGLEGQGYVFLELLDVGNLYARGGIDLIKGDGGADDGLDVGYFYPVGEEGSAYLVVVAVELLVRDLAL